MVNGKSKGSSFERDTCKFLTKYFTGNDKPYVFWRSPSSGAIGISSPNASGDIIALDEKYMWFTDKFNLELKTGYADADFHKHFKDNKNNTIEDFWIQCQKDAKLKNKYGILIFRKKGYQTIIGIQEDIFLQLKTFPTKYMLVSFLEMPKIVFFDFNKFFEIVKPEHLQAIK